MTSSTELGSERRELPLRVAGVDGTRGGWVAIVLEEAKVVADFVIRPIETGFEALGDVSVIAVDVPIGFGPRLADAAARKFLAGAASTVFTTPSREVLDQPFGPGRGVSAQSHALGARIIHVTACAFEDPRFVEVHPEVSFRAMNDGRPLGHRKKSFGGAFERLRLLESVGLELNEIRNATDAPLDDVLDAAAAAWSAFRIASGTAESLPNPPQEMDGRRIAIWY